MTRWAQGRSDLVGRWTSLGALQSDAVLYGLAAFFAVGLGWTSKEPAQWHWGFLAAAPYAGAALAAWWFAGRRPERATVVRVVLLVVVMAGAVALPLSLEARWRAADNRTGLAQPEVSVIERAGKSLSEGQNPYQVYVKDGRLVNAVKGVPAFESFFPYFPLMGVFGLPSAVTHRGNGLTDARIVMSLMTLLVSGLGIGLLETSPRRKVRVAQILLALPTGALFLSTGGDDMPILALSLLGVAALQRRNSALAGVSLGLAAAMKLTAWPLALGALLVARRGDDRRTWRRMAMIMGCIVVGTVLPFAVRAPGAFVSNVFAFPLGLTTVTSPAASALPGHILTTLWPPIGHVLAPLTLLVGGYLAMRYVRRHWPLDLSRMLALLAVAFTVMICVASATRVGYLVYPLNLALWSSVVRVAPVREPVLV
ncbi:MAG: glycosyltransferase 87 family protein [Acidimicrobiales bacterium]